MEFDDIIRGYCERAISQHLFPGCTVGYIDGERKKVLSFGRQTYDETSPEVTADTIYDTASVTKSVTTGTLALRLIEDHKLKLSDRVCDFIPELSNDYRELVTVWHLLTYTVVFDIDGGLSSLAKLYPDEVFEKLCQSPLVAAPGERYYYTNPPAILLGAILEKVAGSSLEDLAQRLLYRPLGMTDSTLNPERLQIDRIAPTETDDRGEVRGVVHDEAAWAMARTGRFAGNAGLFSTAPDLLKFCQMLLGGGEYLGKRILSPETIKTMHTNQIAGLGASTGLGWELNWPSTMGNEKSGQAFGKTGFTGCIVTIDPAQNKALVHLSNRTYPRRQPNREEINAFRRELSDLLFSA